MKYKIGDKVKVRKDLNSETLYYMKDSKIKYCAVGGMLDFCGKKVTIKEILGGVYRIKEYECFWTDEMFEEKANSPKIVITSDGVETLARLYDGNKVIKTATAKCSPDDTFDFEVGAKLAYDRLMEKTIPEAFAEAMIKAYEGIKKTADLLNKKKPAPAEKKWRVVDRPAKVGDYIRIKGRPFSFNRDGEILKVDIVGNDIVSVYDKNHERDTGNATMLWNYCTDEYEVVEPVKEKPHVNKAGDKVKVIANTCYHKCGLGEVVTLEGIYNEDSRGVKWFIREHSGYIRECDFEPYTEPEKPKYFNGKAVCVKSDSDFTVGKVYEFVDGKTKDNYGKTRPCGYCIEKSFDVWKTKSYGLYEFIPFVE